MLKNEGKKKKKGDADPYDGTWNGPSVFPDGCERHDGQDMCHWDRTALRVPMKISTELGEVGYVVWPREGYGKSGEREKDEGGGQREEKQDEEHWGMCLGMVSEIREGRKEDVQIKTKG
jgi:hypothetical protein